MQHITPYFTDEKRAPTQRTIGSALGASAGHSFRQLFEALHAKDPDISEEWRYYVDAKGWLLKVTRKTKTLFWLSLEKHAFHVTFYFPERLTESLLSSELSAPLKAAIRAHAPSGKLRAVTVSFGPARAVRDVLALVDLKRSLR